MVLDYFSGTKACSQIPQCSHTKTKVTRRLKAISVILLTGIRSESRSGYTLFKFKTLFQVQKDLKTEQEMPITGTKKGHGFLKGSQEEDREFLFPKEVPQRERWLGWRRWGEGVYLEQQM